MSRIETVEVGGTEYTLGVDKDSTVTFTEAQTRTNIASGESLATMFGKIKKFFTDLKTVAFTGNISDLTDVTITTPQAEGDVLVSDENGVYQNQPKSLYPSAPTITWAEYQQLVEDEEDDPDAEYYIDDIDVAEAYYVETSGQTALTGATSLTFTNSHIKPTADIRILAEPASCKVSTNPQYKVSAKLSSVGSGTATITFPALAENTTFWLLIECPLAVTVDPAYVYNTDEQVVGTWIDGKTLYRRVATVNNPTNAWATWQTYGVTGISHIVSIDKRFYMSTDGGWWSNEFNNGTDYISITCQDAGFRLKWSNTVGTVAKIVFTIIYTKSS